MTILRERRTALGLSISKFAQQIGINSTQLTAYELRSLKVAPHWRKILAENLNADESELFDREGFAIKKRQLKISGAV